MTVARIFAFAVSVLAAWAQTPATPPLAFDVASVKPSVIGPNGVRGGCHGIDSMYTPAQQAGAPPLGRCRITDARLSHLVSIAWELGNMSMIKSGPDWIAGGAERFDVTAKAENPSKATEKQLLLMLQNMIVERFQMKYHREPAEMAGAALTIDKNGSKLKESKSDDPSLWVGDREGREVGKPGPGQPVVLKARRYSIATLVIFLSAFGGQGPVIDQTGLNGVYDFTLTWDESEGSTLAAALRQQLGLRLESQKVPVSYFVIDSARRPSEN